MKTVKVVFGDEHIHIRVFDGVTDMHFEACEEEGRKFVKLITRIDNDPTNYLETHLGFRKHPDKVYIMSDSGATVDRYSFAEKDL